ncbi:ATP-binding protein [Maritimibacter dapengensis]|uniref:ATP-binding protein n=1 Tax=Maritimibacter dapengensis TaxID=2836868 RepID=A0ABS6T7I3_9RHOB|nr:ATP-binding protein [Maritimibacter dapengensis]MBV7380282.1 ATP-binding protein [Maritimibacter dapengensis]
MLAEGPNFTGGARENALAMHLVGGAGLHLIFPAGEREVRRALTTSVAVLRGMGIGQDAVEFAEIVLAEVLNNVVEHAFADQGRGLVEIEVRHDTDILHVTVRDDGVPMPGDSLPRPKPHDLNVEPGNLPEGGFGWSIIRDLVQDLTYQRDGTRNEITFGLNLAELEDSQ